MKRIPLTQGKVALVDDCDFPMLSKFSWRISRTPYTHYAKRSIGKTSRYMHQDILRISPPKEAHHKNGKGWDNRRKNLRVATRAQNCHGFYTKRKTTSRYRGVSWCSQQNQWLAHIGIKYKRIHLGRFDSERAAANARDRAAKRIFGSYAQLNFP